RHTRFSRDWSSDVCSSDLELLIYPTAIGWHPEEKAEYGERQHAAWETMQRSHAIANGCFVLAVNRVGFEPSPDGNGGIEFWGQKIGRASWRAGGLRQVAIA